MNMLILIDDKNGIFTFEDLVFEPEEQWLYQKPEFLVPVSILGMITLSLAVLKVYFVAKSRRMEPPSIYIHKVNGNRKQLAIGITKQNTCNLMVPRNYF